MSHITATRPINPNVNSETIKVDLLISFHNLEKSNYELREMKKGSKYPLDELSKITQVTINAINVYNENYNYILGAFENLPSNKAVSGRPIPILPELVPGQAPTQTVTVARSMVCSYGEEIYKLGNLCIYFETLKLKIDVTFEKLKKCMSKLQEVGPLELTYVKLQGKVTETRATSLREFAFSDRELRSADPTKPQVKANLHNSQQTIVIPQQPVPVTPSSPISVPFENSSPKVEATPLASTAVETKSQVNLNSHSATVAVSEQLAPATPSLTELEPEPEVELNSHSATVAVSEQLAPPATPSSVKVTINYNVGFGKTLGICCEDEWDKKPISFSNIGDNWSGEVPAGKKWKFVILKNGQVILWEKRGEDRYCEAKADAPTLNCTGLVKLY